MLTHTFQRLFALVTATAVILAVLQPQTAHACSCFWDDTLTDEERMEQKLNSSSMVFVGRADTVTLLEGEDEVVGDLVYFNDGYYHVEMTIDEMYKGDMAQTVKIATHGSGSMCGYTFEEGITYLIFASYNENSRYGDVEWTTSLCAGNERNPAADLISTMGSVAEQVNIPTAVATQEGETESNPANWIWLLPVFLGSSVAIFASRRGTMKEKKPSDL